jgi:hypothetical protein
MLRFYISLGVATVALAAALAGAAKVRSDPPAAEQKKAIGQHLQDRTPVRKIIALLKQDINLHNVPNDKLVLKDVFEFIGTHLKDQNNGKEILILVDANAFREENPDTNAMQILNEEVEIPAFPKRMPVAILLRVALGRLSTGNATYLVLPGTLVITTLREASPARMLSRKVTTSFVARPLKDALDELSDLTGASVIIDGRVDEKVKATPITATFRHDTSLGSALRMLADMAGLKLVVLEDGLYLTPPANAAVLEKEKKKRQSPKKGSTPPPAKAGAGA